MIRAPLKALIFLILLIALLTFANKDVFSEESVMIKIPPERIEDKMSRCMENIRDMATDAAERISKAEEGIVRQERKAKIREHLRMGDKALDSGDEIQAKRHYQKASSLSQEAIEVPSL